jgi:hypothetical protein
MLNEQLSHNHHSLSIRTVGKDKTYINFKDDVHSVLRISSAHNKGGPPDINIAQILHLYNFFELKPTVYIHLQV